MSVPVGVVQIASASYDAAVELDVLLGDARTDAARVGALIASVTERADTLEHELLAVDEPLATFRDDLRADVHHAR